MITHDLHGIVKELNDEGSTIIMVSHDLSGAIAHASISCTCKKGPCFSEQSRIICRAARDALLGEA